MKNLLKKLLKVQAEIKPIPQDGNNPHFKSKYATLDGVLEELKPLCTANGLHLSQLVIDYTLITTVADVESGESMSDRFPLPHLDDLQKFGGAVTYAKRYALKAMFAMSDEDDDGNTATGKVLNPSNVPAQAVQPSTQASTANSAIKQCVMCGKLFTPDTRYPNSTTCGWKCATDKKNGITPTTPVPFHVQQIADQFGGRVLEVMSNPDGRQEDVRLEDVPF